MVQGLDAVGHACEAIGKNFPQVILGAARVYFPGGKAIFKKTGSFPADCEAFRFQLRRIPLLVFGRLAHICFDSFREAFDFPVNLCGQFFDFRIDREKHLGHHILLGDCRSRISFCKSSI